MRYLLTMIVVCLIVWLLCGCTNGGLVHHYPDGSWDELRYSNFLSDKSWDKATFKKTPTTRPGFSAYEVEIDKFDTNVEVQHNMGKLIDIAGAAAKKP